MQLGYANYSFLAVISLFWGWLQLPRELMGQRPVTTSLTAATLHLTGVLVGESIVIYALIWSPSPVPWVLAGSLIMTSSTLTLFFTIVIA